MEFLLAGKFFWRKYTSNIAVFLLIIGLLSVHIHKAASDEQSEEEFNVQPGGQQHTKEKTLNGVMCKFTYIAQGGTNEKWVIDLNNSEGAKQYLCSISRPGGNSYLFFMQFKLEIQGAALENGEAYGASKKPLNHVEYKVDKGETSGSVSSVEGKFQSQLTSVVIGATRGKQEL